MQQAFDHFEQLLFAVPLGSRVKQQILSAHQAAPSTNRFRIPPSVSDASI